MDRITNLAKNLTTAPVPSGPAQSTLSYAGQDNSIGIITMYAKKTYNALTPGMRVSLVANLKTLELDPKVKVVCIRSTHPKVFCAGANIKEFEHADNASWLVNDRFKELDLTLRYYNKPVIGAVHKLALGGGFELALHCDIILAAEDAQFGLPEIKLGIFPGIGGTLLSKTIGKYVYFNIHLLTCFYQA